MKNPEIPLDLPEGRKRVEDKEAEDVFLRDARNFYLRYTQRFPLLTREEEARLSRRIIEEKDEKAVEEMVSHNLRLAIWMAHRFRWSRMQFADLVQEGAIGLLTAARKFDSRTGNRFSTYATWWVRQRISKFIVEHGKMIRLPAHLSQLCFRVVQAAEELSKDGQDRPSNQKIAEHLGIDVAKVERAYRHLSNHFVSLDEATNFPGLPDGTKLSDLIRDDEMLDPSQAREAREELERIALRLEFIIGTVREAVKPSHFRVFYLFYGLDQSRESRTLDAVGKEVGITREGVRVTIRSIWRKVRRYRMKEEVLARYLDQIPDLEDLTGMKLEFQEGKKGYQVFLHAPWKPGVI